MLKFFLVYCSIVPDGLVVTLTCCPIMVHVFKNDAALRKVFPDLRLRRSFTANQKASSANWKASSANQKASSDDAEGFFQRCGRLLLMLRNASSEEAFQRCGQLLNSASSEVVRLHTYVHTS